MSVLAPQAVRTPMTDRPDEAAAAAVDGMIEPEQLADCVVATMAKRSFLSCRTPACATTCCVKPTTSIAG